MELIVYWKDGEIDHQYCDSVSFRMDYKVLVVYIGKDNRTLHLEDTKKIVVKGDN